MSSPATAPPVLPPDATFEAAADAILTYLRDHVPLAVWAVTRVENGRQTFLYLEENSYGMRVGGSHAWEDSFCIRMSTGAAPAVAPDVQSVPAYAASPLNELADVGSYAGTVISEADGGVFGAICGFDPAVRTDDTALVEAGPLLQLLGRLLSMVLASDRRLDDIAATLLLAQLQAETDALTGLLNRRAWDRVVAQEEARFHRFADPTVAVVLDLDLLKTVNDTRGHAAGDDYIRAAGAALRQAVRATDVVARLGGDEFGVLLRDCTEADAAEAVTRIYAELDRVEVAGSVGWAAVSIPHGLPAALAEADGAMYAAKAERRARRTVSGDTAGRGRGSGSAAERRNPPGR